MAVDAQHSEYKVNQNRWQKCRDTFQGSDAVKAAKTQYLPQLDSHNEKPLGYATYITRALFYNAVGRTVEGLAGFVFQSEPTIKVPENIKKDLDDITFTGIKTSMFALGALQELLITGRFGVLVDMLGGDPVETGGEKLRPYWVGYRAEDIVSWRTARFGGDPSVLVRVVLRETFEEEDPEDSFGVVESEQYRVLSIESGVYTQHLFVQKKDSSQWVLKSENIPERLGKPFNRIPFKFIGPTSLSSQVAKPPLLDMVEVNLSHYRTMADLEWGRHFTALPTPWVANSRKQEGGKLYLGSGKAWDLDKGGTAGMLEFTGKGLEALVTAEQDKRKMMAVLGARLLEEIPAVAETMGAVYLRHSGEGATLRMMVNTLEQGLMEVLQIHAWWMSTEKKPEDIKVTFELNKEFFAVKLPAPELQTQLQLLQAEAISYATFYHNITIGGWTRPGIDSKKEQVTIEREGGFGSPDPVDPEPDLDPDKVVDPKD